MLSKILTYTIVKVSSHSQDEIDSGGGGFLIEAGDVVEAFQLPKYNPLLLLDSTSSNPFAKRHSATVSGGNKADGDPSTMTEKHEYRHLDREEERPTIDFVTYDLDDEYGHGLGPMDVDEGGTRSESSDPPITQFSSPISLAGLALEGQVQMDEDAGKEAPRAMQDFLDAEEATNGKARTYFNTSGRASELSPSSSGGVSTSAKRSSGSLAQTVAITGEGQTIPKRQLRSGRNVAPGASALVTTSSDTNGTSRTTRGAGQSLSSKASRKAAARKKGTTTGTKRAAKTSTKRKRGKRRKADDDDEEEEETFSEGGLDEDAAQADENSDSPRKRLRVTPVDGEELSVVEPIVSSTTGRTLRPRRTKTAAQLDEEKEAERAFRKAVAQ